MSLGNFNTWESYQFGLLPLVIYREARGQPDDAMAAVGWVVKNRVAHPKWWGTDIPSVVLAHYQFSSFNANDPNSRAFMAKGLEADHIMQIAFNVYWSLTSDPTGGATYYFDKSLDSNPPNWSKTMTHTVDIGAFHFYKET